MNITSALSSLLLVATLAVATVSGHAADNRGDVTPATKSFRSATVVDHAPTVMIDVDAGDVTIKRWPHDKVVITSTGADATLEREAATTPRQVVFTAKTRPNTSTGTTTGISHVVYVPASATVTVFSVKGDVAVSGIYGPVSVNVDHGDIRLQDVSDVREVGSATGSITRIVPDADGQMVEVPYESGN